MSSQEVEIIRIIQEALGPGETPVTRESTRDDIEAWDSLGHLAILAALDEHFHGKVGDIKEIASVESVTDILQILHNHSLV